jgi:hypothetical protein
MVTEEEILAENLRFTLDTFASCFIWCAKPQPIQQWLDADCGTTIPVRKYLEGPMCLKPFLRLGLVLKEVVKTGMVLAHRL